MTTGRLNSQPACFFLPLPEHSARRKLADILSLIKTADDPTNNQDNNFNPRHQQGSSQSIRKACTPSTCHLSPTISGMCSGSAPAGWAKKIGTAEVELERPPVIAFNIWQGPDVSLVPEKPGPALFHHPATGQQALQKILDRVREKRPEAG